MPRLKFPPAFKHAHPPVRNLNEVVSERLTLGERIADRVVARIGSWGFVIVQSTLLCLWAFLNLTAWVRHWDPYPFILMNLFLSLQAAYTAPLIMMSQNRQADRDRLEAHHDYQINLKAETEIQVILEILQAQNEALAEMHALLEEVRGKPPGDSTPPASGEDAATILPGAGAVPGGAEDSGGHD